MVGVGAITDESDYMTSVNQTGVAATIAASITQYVCSR